MCVCVSVPVCLYVSVSVFMFVSLSVSAIQVLTTGVFTLSETWLRKGVSDSMIQVEGYTVFRRDRSDKLRAKRGGGLLCFVKESIAANTIELNDLNLVNPDIQA